VVRSSRSADLQVRRVGQASRPALQLVHADIVSCERCPRLREYCQRIGREKRRAFRDDTYWAKPVPGFGDPEARMLLIGLAPAASSLAMVAADRATS
jgi:uracil-DNA glycosylase